MKLWVVSCYEGESLRIGTVANSREKAASFTERHKKMQHYPSNRWVEMTWKIDEIETDDEFPDIG